MPQTIFETDDATFAFKNQNWRVRRTAHDEWAISSPSGDPVGVLRCVSPLGNDGESIFDLTLPGAQEPKETEGTDWLSIVEYAINEYLDKQDRGLAGYVE